ncbi:unnamed protein product [Rotaria magnacalcarata]|uniref:Uncharacterized protein n=2 Tax=Rotaria magnacalcarata TaxID=392030 RepID=A0A819VU29_9BILA|nr:unnamed protein product [Rotaria magnacalcarata]CAF4122256.1 unnamed protein product [Rotaria magnacalcarata]
MSNDNLLDPYQYFIEFYEATLLGCIKTLISVEGDDNDNDNDDDDDDEVERLERLLEEYAKKSRAELEQELQGLMEEILNKEKDTHDDIRKSEAKLDRVSDRLEKVMHKGCNDIRAKVKKHKSSSGKRSTKKDKKHNSDGVLEKLEEELRQATRNRLFIMEDDAISSASKRITEINRMLQNGIQDIENLAKEHANDGDIDKYEIMLDEKSEQLKKSLSNEIESLKQSIRVYRPQKSDSIEKQRNYVQYFKIMDDSVFADNFCDRITNLGTIYSNIAESATNSDSELDRLDNELDCAAADLETELHNQLEEYVNGVKSKKPHNAKPNDPEYEAYKSTIQKATAEVKRTTNWLSKIFSKIRDMIGKIIDKIKKKASDTVDWITKWFKNIFK